MFHIANKVYLEVDYKFESDYPSIVASSRWASHPITMSKKEVLFQVKSFEHLLETRFDNDIEKFWTYLFTHKDKLVVYLDPATLKKLMTQYWISIFEDTFKFDDFYLMIQSWYESIRLRGYLTTDDRYWADPEVLQQMAKPTMREAKKLFDETSISQAIVNSDKTTISFEYLLADFLADHTSEYKDELMKRIKFMTWDNWLDELDHLKYELLSGALDARSIDPTINPRVGYIEEEFSKSAILSWVVDLDFRHDIEYIRRKYDYKIFDPCWTLLAKTVGVEYDDMSELNKMINEDRYEELLFRDIERGYGCNYTRTRFMNKCNQMFSMYCYVCHRENTPEKLAPFKIRS
jgi:hypothetical protein